MTNEKILDNAINFLRDKKLIDGEFMESDDVKRLQETIDGLEVIKRLEDAKKVEEVKDFTKYVDESIPYADASNDVFKKFFGFEWSITYADKSIKLANSIDMCDGIVSLLTNIFTK